MKRCALGKYVACCSVAALALVVGIVVAYLPHGNFLLTVDTKAYVAEKLAFPTCASDSHDTPLRLGVVTIAVDRNEIVAVRPGPNAKHAVVEFRSGVELLVSAPQDGEIDAKTIERMWRVYTASPTEFSWTLPGRRVRELRHAIEEKMGLCDKSVQKAAIRRGPESTALLLVGKHRSELQWAINSQALSGTVLIAEGSGRRDHADAELAASIAACISIDPTNVRRWSEDLQEESQLYHSP